MVKKSENTENEIRDKFIHIAFSEREKQQFKKYAKESNTSLSEFIRQALYDKIMRIENPEKFGNVVSNEEQLNEIIETQKNQQKLLELIAQKTKIMNGINEKFETLKPIVEESEVKKEAQTIMSLLKIHEQLSIPKIEALTNFDKTKIFEAIAFEKDKLELLDNGDVRLK